MDPKISGEETHLLVDLESGTSSLIDERLRSGGLGSDSGQGKSLGWTGFAGGDGSVEGDQVGNLEKKNVGGAEKKNKKGTKKCHAPKPPRPPKSPSLDAADQKLVREFSELAMLKRARMERMRALKKMKNAKPTTSSSSSICALLITIIFSILIIWQGVLSRGSSGVTFQGSPESSLRPRDGLISVQFYRDISNEGPHRSSSASPNNVEEASGLDDHGEGSRMIK